MTTTTTPVPAAAPAPYPVRVEARLEEPLSRWLWLVKWLLLIPHYVVLAFLWVAFVVTTVVAFVAVLITGRYPRGIFGFNVGVLRWSWRVAYYGYSALGTDRYPPFSLAEEPDYPATLDIAYPEHLSRGLVLVKWWLLALPHYLILAALAGGATWVVSDTGTRDVVLRTPGGVLTLAVLFVAMGLLFAGRYPRGLYDLVMGVNRWALRVCAYAALMTDAYPPFRLDQGGAEQPAAPGPPPGWSGGGAGAARAPGGAGAVVAMVVGLLAVVPALGLTAGGGATLWLDSHRDSQGFVSTDAAALDTPTAAMTVEDVDLTLQPRAARWLRENDIGRIRVRVTGGTTPVFVGIARSADVDRWLAGTAHDEITGVRNSDIRYRRAAGPVSAVTSPESLGIWVASASGTGQQQVDWPVANGTWSLVVAHTDGSPGVHSTAQAAITVPDLTGLGVGLLLGGLALLAVGVVLVVVGASGLGHRAGSGPVGGAPGPGTPPAPPAPAEPQVPASSGAPR